MKRILGIVWLALLSACQTTQNRNETADWQSAVRAGTPSAYQTYLKRHPEGCKRVVAAKALRKKVINQYCGPRKKKIVQTARRQTGPSGSGSRTGGGGRPSPY